MNGPILFNILKGPAHYGPIFLLNVVGILYPLWSFSIIYVLICKNIILCFQLKCFFAAIYIKMIISIISTKFGL